MHPRRCADDTNPSSTPLGYPIALRNANCHDQPSAAPCSAVAVWGQRYPPCVPSCGRCPLTHQQRGQNADRLTGVARPLQRESHQVHACCTQGDGMRSQPAHHPTLSQGPYAGRGRRGPPFAPALPLCTPTPATHNSNINLPSRAGVLQGAVPANTASLPTATPWSLTPISAPHIQSGLHRRTPWVWRTCEQWAMGSATATVSQSNRGEKKKEDAKRCVPRRQAPRCRSRDHGRKSHMLPGEWRCRCTAEAARGPRSPSGDIPRPEYTRAPQSPHHQRWWLFWSMKGGELPSTRMVWKTRRTSAAVLAHGV
jgi:hypothetical protein